MSKQSAALAMLGQDLEIILQDLKYIQEQTAPGIESIDVRLCIDFDRQGNPTWMLRSGDASYDQRHSEVCGAASVDADDTHRSDLISILENLMSQCTDQCAEIDSFENTKEV